MSEIIKWVEIQFFTELIKRCPDCQVPEGIEVSPPSSGSGAGEEENATCSNPPYNITNYTAPEGCNITGNLVCCDVNGTKRVCANLTEVNDYLQENVTDLCG